MIELAQIDRELLDGQLGPAAAHAMSILVRYASAIGSPAFISVSSAHIDGCLYHGPSSIDFVRRFTEMGGKVRIPTTLNVAAVDVVHGCRDGSPNELVSAQNELTALHVGLGCLPTLTCAPYQRTQRPRFAEHVNWAESNAIVFVNSVLGARTDRYGDFTDLCAALTGRVPLAGLHCDENRHARIIFDVAEMAAIGLPRDLFFACLGYALGERCKGRVPVLVNLPGDASQDELKSLGSAAASSGSVALFHAVGVTPEAPTLLSALGGSSVDVERASLGKAELTQALNRLCRLEVGETVAVLCLGTPHFSLDEFESLVPMVDGRQLSAGVACFVSTSREIAEHIKTEPRFAPLFAFGMQLVVDTCTYLAPTLRRIQGTVITNSAKWAHYGPGNLQRRAGLMTLERCIRSAVSAKVAPP